MKNKNKNTKKNKVGNKLMNNSTNLQLMNTYQLQVISMLRGYYKQTINKLGVEGVNEDIQKKIFKLKELPSCECCDDHVYPMDGMLDTFLEIYTRFDNNSLTKEDTEFLSNFK